MPDSEMAILAFLKDFNLSWQTLINDKSYFLLSRYIKWSVPLTQIRDSQLSFSLIRNQVGLPKRHPFICAYTIVIITLATITHLTEIQW